MTDWQRIAAHYAAREAHLRDRQAALRWLLALEATWVQYARCRAYYEGFRHLRSQLFDAVQQVRADIVQLGWELSEAPDYSSAHEGGEAMRQKFEEDEAYLEDKFLKSICH
jgi:hypothetical protein